MSSVYKIGAELATAVGVQDFTIRVSNMANDTAEVVLNKNVDVAIPSPLNTWSDRVTLWKDSTRIFTGTVGNPSYAQSWSAENITVKLDGPWQFLERTFYQVNSGYYNSAGSPNQTLVLSGVTMAAALTSILSPYSSSYFILGTISLPTFTIPPLTVQNGTLAQAVRSILKYCPDAVVSFDYSTALPTLYIFSSTASVMASFQTWEATAYRCTDFTFENRHDLTFALVYFWYYRTYIRPLRQWLLTQTTKPVESSTTHQWFEGVESAGGGAGNISTQMVLLPGTRKDLRLEFDRRLINTIPFSTVIQYVGSRFPHWPWLINFVSPQNLALYSLWLYPANNYGSAYHVDKMTGLSEFCTLDCVTNPSAWYMVEWNNILMPPQELWSTAGFAGFEVAEIDLFMEFRQPVPNNNLGFDMSVTIKLVKPMQAGTIIFREINQNDTNLSAVPTGVAARVLADNSTVRADGSAKITADEPVIPSVFQRKVVTRTGSSGLVQSFDVRMSSGETTLRFGPPSHLTPDDFRNVINANV